jgi:hypothetical protein
MILPIGSNCKVAEALKKANVRLYSYPFDWIAYEFTKYNFKFILDCLTVSNENLEQFIYNIFHNNIIYETVPFNKGNKHITNTFYNVSFIHDNIDNIYEKYTRRIKRLREHFFNDKEVHLIYSERWVKSDEQMLQFINDIRNIRSDVIIHIINTLEKDIDIKNVYLYKIDYTLDHVPLIDGVNRDWSYDNVYENKMSKLFEKIFKNI